MQLDVLFPDLFCFVFHNFELLNAGETEGFCVLIDIEQGGAVRVSRGVGEAERVEE